MICILLTSLVLAGAFIVCYSVEPFTTLTSSYTLVTGQITGNNSAYQETLVTTGLDVYLPVIVR